MAAGSDVKRILRRLSDSNVMIVDPAQDVRGRQVEDAAGQKIGKIDDLFIDEPEKRVRFLEVSSGGFLGMGDSKSLVPVDAIDSVSKDTVRINKHGDSLRGAPAYDPEIIDEASMKESYLYYGYEPYWGAGYAYPMWKV